MKDFTTQKEDIKKYKEPKKSLRKCPETLKLLEEENKNGNPYIVLGRKFELYKQGEKEEHADWYFFKYLESLENKEQYTFSVGDEEIIVSVNLLEPYIEIKNNQGKQRVIDPQWHLMVSYYAYIYSMYNHDNNKYAKEIKEKQGHPSGRFGIKCKSLLKWMEEGFKK